MRQIARIILLSASRHLHPGPPCPIRSVLDIQLLSLEYGPYFRLGAHGAIGMNSIGIGTLAKRAGVSIDTVRYYEKSGLLEPEARLPSGYRR